MSVLSVKLLPRHTVIHWRNKSKKHHIRQKAPRAVVWIQARYHTIPETRSPFCRRNGTRLKTGLPSSIRLESTSGLPHRLRLVDLARPARTFAPERYDENKVSKNKYGIRTASHKLFKCLCEAHSRTKSELSFFWRYVLNLHSEVPNPYVKWGIFQYETILLKY